MLFTSQMVCYKCNKKIPHVVSQGPNKKPICPKCNQEVEFNKCIPKEERHRYEMEKSNKRNNKS